jgi:DNA-binding transcriptional LysR family regulator
MGVALLPEWAVAQCLSDGRLVRGFSEYDITAGEFDRAAWLVYPCREQIPHKTSVFINFFKSKFKGVPNWANRFSPVDLLQGA